MKKNECLHLLPVPILYSRVGATYRKTDTLGSVFFPHEYAFTFISADFPGKQAIETVRYWQDRLLFFFWS